MVKFVLSHCLLQPNTIYDIVYSICYNSFLYYTHRIIVDADNGPLYFCVVNSNHMVLTEIEKLKDVPKSTTIIPPRRDCTSRRRT